MDHIHCPKPEDMVGDPGRTGGSPAIAKRLACIEYSRPLRPEWLGRAGIQYQVGRSFCCFAEDFRVIGFLGCGSSVHLEKVCLFSLWSGLSPCVAVSIGRPHMEYVWNDRNQWVRLRSRRPAGLLSESAWLVDPENMP